MVTATNGTATFKGLQSGKVYNVDIYISDVVAATVKLNQFGAAVVGSPSFVRFDEDVALVDLSIITGPTVMVGLYPTSNDVPVSQYNYRIANFLNSIQTRPVVRVGFASGKNIGFIQY